MQSIAKLLDPSSAKISPWRPPLPRTAGRYRSAREPGLPRKKRVVAGRKTSSHRTPTPGHPAQNNGHCPRALRFILHSAYAEVVESLLRRGARVELSRRAGTALPRGAACPRWAGKTSFCWGLTDEKTVSVRAPWEIIPDKLIVYRFDFLLRRGARGFPPNFATQTQQKPLWGRSALESWSLLGNKLRLPYASGGLLRLR